MILSIDPNSCQQLSRALAPKSNAETHEQARHPACFEFSPFFRSFLIFNQPKTHCSLLTPLRSISCLSQRKGFFVNKIESEPHSYHFPACDLVYTEASPSPSIFITPPAGPMFYGAMQRAGQW